MKKLMFLLFVISFMLISCDNRSPTQKATDEYNAQKTAQRAKAMKHEKYIDNLVNIAAGMGEYKYMRENRLNAIDILKKEYPTLIEKWNEYETAILAGDY